LKIYSSFVVVFVAIRFTLCWHKFYQLLQQKIALLRGGGLGSSEGWVVPAPRILN